MKSRPTRGNILRTVQKFTARMTMLGTLAICQRALSRAMQERPH
jgi:hypothetical protein